jgi:hypothetical protein
MKILKYYWASFLIILAIASCSKFEEMNYDPNRPSFVPTSALLTQAQANLVYNLSDELSQLGMQYVQYLGQLDYPDKSNYADEGSSSYTGIYLGGLTDLQEIIELNQNALFKDRLMQYGDNINQIAVAKILQTWAFHSMTDVWGDIPYSEALRGKDNIITPVYDTQEAIYDGLINTLDKAILDINTTPQVSLKGDLIFNGNMNSWKAFANSLRLRIAMRLSEVNNTKANNLIDDAHFTASFSTSAHFARFAHLATNAEANPLYIDNFVIGGADYFAVANTLVDAMNALNDPRLPRYAKPTVANGTYVGITYGLGTPVSDQIVSMPGDLYGGQTAPSIIMTAAEILFIKAEAAQRGYISGGAASAAQFYNDAIRASMEYNTIPTAQINTYLAQPAVQYNEANWKQLIGTQKWIALYMQGIQAWAEWRRLGFPTLVPGPAAVLTTIPTRRAYPSTEYSTNKKNIEDAVKRLASGQDKMTEKVWWDK